MLLTILKFIGKRNASNKIRLIPLKANIGLAKGLNIGLKVAGYKNYILTLDQDTIIRKNALKLVLSDYKKLNSRIKNKTAIIHLNYEKLGHRWIDKLIFNSLRLNKTELNHNKNFYRDFLPVNFVIQSGMLIKPFAIKRFKFMNSLFIDQIDREYCSRIAKHGFIILESKKIFTRHKLGIRKKVNTQIIHYESATRLRYFTRNSAYLLKTKKLPIIEYSFGIFLFYRKYVLANGIKTVPLLFRLYISSTIDGLKGKLGKISNI